MKIRYFWPLAVCLLALPYFWTLDRALGMAPLGEGLMMGDFVDQAAQIRGLSETRSFRDTLEWWTGDWVQWGQTSEYQGFYRPLTSLFWWIQFQLFGGVANGLFGFLAVHHLLHFAVALGFVGFLRLFASDKIALFAGVLWTGCLIESLTLPSPFWALTFWKDDPDLWVSGAILVSLACLTTYFRTGNRRFLGGVFGAQLFAIGIKEMAYVLPFMALVVCWHEKAWHRWRVLGALFGVTLAAYAFRWWALQGPGFRFGTNGSWLERFLSHCVGGRPLNLLIEGEVLALALALLLISLLGLWLRQRKIAAFAFALGMGGALWSQSQATYPFDALLRLMAPFVAAAFGVGWVLHQDIFLSLALLSVAVMFVSRRERPQILAYGWVLTAYLPMLTAPITDHALYLSSMGWALFFALTTRQLAHAFRFRKSSES